MRRKTPPSCKKHNRNALWEDVHSSCGSMLSGQHSLTSLERPSYLRSDFVNVWRHARLVVPLVTHVSFASIIHFDLSDDLMFVSRSCLAFSIIPRLIQPRRCHCICLERMFFKMFRLDQASFLAHQEGPLSGCYWVTSLEWPRINWHSWRIANKTQMNRCLI